MASAESLAVLLTGCAHRDHAAFERLYRAAAPKLFGLCVTMLGNQDQAADVLQETFVQIWRDAARFDRRRASAMTWMAVIARHRALDALRRRGASAEPLEGQAEDRLADPDPGPLDAVMQDADARALGECLEQLGDDQRKAVSLAFFQGLSHAELSRRLGAPLGTVKSQIRRAIERLRRCLER